METSNLKQYDNSWYYPGASNLKRVCWYFFNILLIKNGWNPSSGIKVMALKLFGAKVGKKVTIKPNVNIKYPWLLEIGDYCWIGEDVWIDNLVRVTIGKNVCLSQGAMLLTGNHNYKLSTFDLIVGEVILEDGVWIGAKAIVCPGVTCYSHSVLAVSAIATKDLIAYSIYQGNPASFVRERTILS